MTEADTLRAVNHTISRLLGDGRQLEAAHAARVVELPEPWQGPARNLLHYLALRRISLKDEQQVLGENGLNTLVGLEPNVQHALLAVLRASAHLLEEPEQFAKLAGTTESLAEPLTPRVAAASLKGRADDLLGDELPDEARIMVTIKEAMSTDELGEIISAGGRILRINCSRGSEQSWRDLAQRVREAERRAGAQCRIEMDLAGATPLTVSFESDQDLVVKRGDVFVVERSSSPSPTGEPDVPRIGCTGAEFLEGAKPGDPIHFNDGKLQGTVRKVSAHSVEVRVDVAKGGARTLRGGKGINLPASEIDAPALSPRDEEHLPFVTEHADIVGISFARRPTDVRAIVDRIHSLGHRSDVGIVVKIETSEAFECLPRIILEAMRTDRAGVMVARGDLGVEAGFERTAEIQQEMLWLCEAAHLPVVWATQVMEGLTKKGVPRRGEITDAAVAARADCVMLNKGEYVVEAVHFLRDMVARMRTHQKRSQTLYRALRVANAL